MQLELVVKESRSATASACTAAGRKKGSSKPMESQAHVAASQSHSVTSNGISGGARRFFSANWGPSPANVLLKFTADALASCCNYVQGDKITRARADDTEKRLEDSWLRDDDSHTQATCVHRLP